MADIIPIVETAVQIALPLIPSAISFFEQVFGGGNGPQKKQASVDLLQAGLVTLANAGKIPSAGVVDPSLPAALADEVQKAFDRISVKGKIPNVQAPAAPALFANVATGGGRTFLVIEVPST